MRRVGLFSHLKNLSIFGVETTLADEALNLLAKILPEDLESLEIPYFELSDDGIIDFFKDRKFTKLRHLDLQSTEIGDEGIVSILTSGGVPKLENLLVGGNALTLDGIMQISTLKETNRLKNFAFISNYFGEEDDLNVIEALKIIAESKNFRKLENIYLPISLIKTLPADLLTRLGERGITLSDKGFKY